MPKIRKCKCGATPIISWKHIPSWGEDSGQRRYFVGCQICPKEGGAYAIKEVAIKEWNDMIFKEYDDAMMVKEVLEECGE